MQEIWKNIPEYEGLYQVSNFGRVKSLDRFNYKGHHNLEKILKPVKNVKNNYLYVTLCKNKKTKTFSLHRLVAICFIPNPDNLPVINHKDGNKSNNSVDNLEFCSYSHNEREAFRLRLKKTKPILQYDINDNFIKRFDSVKEAKESLSIKGNDIISVCKGRRKTCGGYKWRYESEVVK